MVRISKVSIFVREHVTRKYKKAKPKFGADSKVGYGFPPGTIFVLRYERSGKRVWETLDTDDYAQAKIEAKRRELELMTGEKPAAQKKAEATPNGNRLVDVIAAYLKELRDNRRPERSVKSKQTELEEFSNFCSKPVEEIKRSDLIA